MTTSSHRLGRNRSTRACHLHLETLEPRQLLTAEPVISEFLALNQTGLVDEDGDTSDWIEIRNQGDSALDLAGWYLTDDADELDKWTFPVTTLGPGELVVVFASGKMRTNSGPNGEHHANFGLSADGGYLALVQPDGATIADAFSPEYPKQRGDISYGRARDAIGEPLVSTSSTARVLVPANDSLQNTWRGNPADEPFNDAAWQAGTYGVGYDQGGLVGSESYGPDVIDRTALDFWHGTYVLRDPLAAGAEGIQTITDWSFFNDTPSAVGRQITPVLIEQVNSEFFVRGLGQTRDVTAAGVQSFPFALQDGVDTFDPQSGSYHLAFRSGSPATSNPGVVEYSNSESSWTFLGSISSATPIEVGAKPSGLEIAFSRDYSIQFTLAQGGFDSIIGTNIETAMAGNNASAYVRSTFEVDSLENTGGLKLNMRYDDGFVAFINGVEVARRNAPANPAFNSTATGDRSRDEIFVTESIDISDHLGSLFTGTNVLAIHGLNDTAASEDFLVSPDLVLLATEITGYLADPSPGSENLAAATDFVADTTFSVDRGFFTEPFEIEVTSQTPGAFIVYTTDGSTPTESHGIKVSAADSTTPPVATIQINGTTSLRAAAFKEGLFPTNADTQTYLFISDVVEQSMMNSRITNDAEWGPQLEDSLLALPTISLVTSSSISQTERATSVEMIFPDGSAGFQVDAGVEHFGGHSLNSQKKNMRLSFKQAYGPTKLDFNVFDDPDAADSFDQLLLRTGSHDNFFWVHPGGARGNYVRARWAFDTQREMGHVAPRGRFVHVYVNGRYEGMHNLMERPNASFMASYDGGDRDDYDALNKGAPIDGNKDAWNAMKNSIGNYAELSRRMDIENYIDYMLQQFFGGNDWDWNANQNWAAAGRADASEGYKFFAWDSDVILRTGFNANVVSRGGPENIWNLNGGPKQHQEFLDILADRAQKHFFNGGVFTAERFRAQIDALAAEIELAIIAETARWGNGSFSTNSNEYYTPAVWRREIEWMKDTYGSLTGRSRTELVIEQMRQAGVFPEIAAPEYLINGDPQHDGEITAGAFLEMTATATEVTEDTVLITQGSPALAFVPSDASLETGAGPYWYESDFTPSGWVAGVNGVGYEDSPADYQNLIGTDIRDEWNAHESSVYTRFAFELPQDFNADNVDRFTLRVKFDDGFVAYLNGQEVARQSAPAGTVSWQSNATSSRLDLLAQIFLDIDVGQHLELLNGGTNVLAIHALNQSAGSSDLLILPELLLRRIVSVDDSPIYYTLDGRDPRGPDRSPAGTLYTGQIALAESTEVQARAFAGNTWSALSAATFVVPIAASGLVISEINYNPHAPTAAELFALPEADNDDFEFIEVLNVHPTDEINLLGSTLSGGVAFTFPAERLAPGERAVIVEDEIAFRQRYGDTAVVLGQWSGGLSNGGERIVLSDGLGQTLLAVEYNDARPWPIRADGSGGSLVLIDENTTPNDQFSKPYRWRGSANFGGSPGSAASAPIGIVINEVLAHTDPPIQRSDSIELLNVTAEPIDMSGWFLSDAGSNLLKYQIPDGTLLGPGEFIVFDEDDFNPTPLTPGPADFALSGTSGDDVWLVIPDSAGGVGSFVDDVHFDASANGESFGRLPNGDLAPQSRETIGCSNSAPRTGPIVLSELQYNPRQPSTTALAIWPDLDVNDLEYLEIHNPTTADVSLDDWRIRGGVDLDFDAGLMLPAGETLLVVTFDPVDPDNADRLAAFRTHYGIDNQVAVTGGFAGQLSNAGERVQLQRPDQSPAGQPDVIPRLSEDEVIYDNLAPWPALIAGQSLLRRAPVFYGSQETSWTASHATPGSVDYAGGVLGDFTGDGQVTSNDIDLLFDAAQREPVATYFDLDGNGIVDQADASWLLQQIGVLPGDANLDGVVDGSDFNRWNDNKFANCTKLWEHGDFNGDGGVDAADFNIWTANRFMPAAAPASLGRRTPRAPLAAVEKTSAVAPAAGVQREVPGENKSLRAAPRILSMDHTSITNNATTKAVDFIFGRWNRAALQKSTGSDSSVSPPDSSLGTWQIALLDEIHT